MIDVPIGCADRLDFIERWAAELSDTFINGNRKDLLHTLEAVPPRVAFAVLATILDNAVGKPKMSASLARFLQEMA
jgi:hypothetical protein